MAPLKSEWSGDSGGVQCGTCAGEPRPRCNAGSGGGESLLDLPYDIRQLLRALVHHGPETPVFVLCVHVGRVGDG